MQPCIANVWRAATGEPRPDRLPLDRELVLDRELFAINDASISRAANAPRLISLSSRRVRLVVPAQCATGVVVIHRMNFDALHRRISSCQDGYPRARVADLARSLVMARGAHTALALLRSSSPNTERPDQLVTLPATVKLTGPVDVELAAPAIVIVGSGAIAIQPGITAFPDSGENIVDHCLRFRLPSVESMTDLERVVDLVGSEQPEGLIRVAGCEEGIALTELPRVAAAVLARVGRRAWFAPALVDDRQPRLCLLYERRDGGAAGSVSPAEIEPWLQQLRTTLVGARKAVGARPAVAQSVGYKVITNATRSSTPELPPTPAATPAATPVPLQLPARFGEVLSHNPRFAHDLDYLRTMRNVELGILLLGESGTGKEHLAREIHAHSRRAQGPFVALNVSSLTESLIESELFGHVKGAYTGTHSSREGMFSIADGGTLLLDEIADAPLRVQLSLLRVLESRSFRPLGADRERSVDVRVIAATSRDIVQLMRADTFRRDLFYRIAETTLTLPPLRERVEDIPHIARTLLKDMKCALPLTDDAVEALQQRQWSGNIRALRGTLRQAAQLAEGAAAIAAEHVTRLPDLDPLAPAAVGALSPAAPVEFPRRVREAGDELWQKQELPPRALSQYERRAIHRAALIYLAVQRGKNAFSNALFAQWTHLFGERWWKTENERGLRDVLRLLGTSLRDDAARGWVLAIVQT